MLLYFEDENEKKDVERWVLGKGDYEKMRMQMGVIDWSVMDGLDTEESWQFIKSNIINLMHENIPKQGDKGSENRQPR